MLGAIFFRMLAADALKRLCQVLQGWFPYPDCRVAFYYAFVGDRPIFDDDDRPWP